MQIARLNNHRPSKKKDGREASCEAQAQEEGKKERDQFFHVLPYSLLSGTKIILLLISCCNAHPRPRLFKGWITLSTG